MGLFYHLVHKLRAASLKKPASWLSPFKQKSKNCPNNRDQLDGAETWRTSRLVPKLPMALERMQKKTAAAATGGIPPQPVKQNRNPSLRAVWSSAIGVVWHSAEFWIKLQPSKRLASNSELRNRSDWLVQGRHTRFDRYRTTGTPVYTVATWNLLFFEAL
jgi:hypothetical protein